MSYRTRLENMEIFGDNECPSEWMDFIRKKGIEPDADDCYDGTIDDVEGIFKTIDKITKRLINEQHKKVLRGEKFLGRPCKELTDLSGSIFLSDKDPILLFNMQIINNAYIFLPYQVYLAIKDKIEICEEPYKKSENDDCDWLFCSYRIKDGETIHVHAG